MEKHRLAVRVYAYPENTGKAKDHELDLPSGVADRIPECPLQVHQDQDSRDEIDEIQSVARPSEANESPEEASGPVGIKKEIVLEKQRQAWGQNEKAGKYPFPSGKELDGYSPGRS